MALRELARLTILESEARALYLRISRPQAAAHPEIVRLAKEFADEAASTRRSFFDLNGPKLMSDDWKSVPL